MNQSTTPPQARQFSSRTPLAAVGVKLRQLDLFGPVRERVRIAQKTVKDTPVDKLYDGFIAILAGVRGMGEINKRLRSDPVLQNAFGRARCAEQSVVQDTLDACTAANVEQMEQAMDMIYRQRSQGYQHDYRAQWQVLDVDMTGMPCGKKAALAQKGYFANQYNRRGRQLGRVLATRYGEVVVDRLFGGRTQLTTAFQPLVQAAERTLELDAPKRARTILRVDGGGGSLDDVNWALERGYQFHGKDYSVARAHLLAQSVETWVDDPLVPERQVGWVTLEPTGYVRPIRRIAVRCRKKNGQWGIGVLLSTLSAVHVLVLTGQSPDQAGEDTAVLLAYVHYYDQRGGGIETATREDKQGLGLTKRNKKRFEAQQILSQLAALAHNVIVWARRWLASHEPKIAALGILRMVRDVFTLSGYVVRNGRGQIEQIVLNHVDPLASRLAPALRELLNPEHVSVISGEI